MSIWGDGLLDRARSTSLALLGLTAAVGLALVAYVAHQGWPLLPGSPIPSITSPHGSVHDAEIAAPAPGSGSGKSAAEHATTAAAAGSFGAATSHSHKGGQSPTGSKVGKTD